MERIPLPRRRRPAIAMSLAMAIGAMAAGAGCSSKSTTQQEPCEPDEASPCITPSGCEGLKTCRADGSGFGSCECKDAGAGGAAGSSAAGGTGNGGAAGLGGHAGSSGGGGDAGQACPGTAGPDMVVVPALGGTYCVDSTEVTNAHYAAFLAAAGTATDGQPSFCAFNTDFTPSAGWPATGMEDHPVTSVDWCDAFAYCEWAGKRLCGKIGGGSLTRNGNDADATASQWFNACSAGGMQSYPYPGSYSASACNGVELNAGRVMAVGEATGCEGGFTGLFDMSGNAGEWLDACSGSAGGGDVCNVFGGSYLSGAADMTCASRTSANRSQDGPGLGFRCCAP